GKGYRPVQAGRLYDGLRVIESGLSKGEKVIVTGLQRVRPGSKVEATLVPMPTRASLAKAALRQETKESKEKQAK
ncbi:MAG TPA: hypothetical protein VMR25_16935, partial [Planctomycetaceae bacterium]|nr:hypothetical protein [Planctomycetaceae bacterium]